MPNPATSGFVRFYYGTGTPATVTIYDEARYVVARLRDDMGVGEAFLDVTNLPPGAYVCRVRLDGRTPEPLFLLLVRR
jgi:hypothetical protein